MFGLLLIALGTFTSEVGTSIGKREVTNRKESIYTMGFLNLLWGTLFLLALAFLVPKNVFAQGFPGGFVFAAASLPTFLLRLFLEIAQVHVAILAITRSDRTTFEFLRILTIPLLLAVDFVLGYTIDLPQIGGIGLILISLIFLFMNHGIRKEGLGLVLFTAINAVATLSLFKYNISHFNSVEAEQSIIMAILTIYFFIAALWVAKENPIQFLRKPTFLLQSIMKGVAEIFISFAYLFGPTSIITTGKRSFAILWAILSGNMYFHEKGLWIKCIALVFIIVGLALLVL